jgi:large subunit ribosomal protein L16
MKRRGKLWVRSFPWKPVTKKPTEVRMGKGKGDPEFWVDVIRPGKIIYELEGVSVTIAKEAMVLAARKLPIKTRFISRESRELR